MKEYDHLTDKDKYAKKIVQASGLEAPSQNFTASVKAKIETYEQQRLKIVYKPLISKRIWSIISLGVLAIYVVTFSQTLSFSWIKTRGDINLDKWINPGLQFLDQLSLSGFFLEVVVYFLFLTLLVLAFLKYRIDRKWGYPGLFS